MKTLSVGGDIVVSLKARAGESSGDLVVGML